jgi:calcium-dependent protein kinase
MKNFKTLRQVKDISQHYILGEKLGEGQFGKVYRARHKGMQTDWALKIIDKSSFEKKPIVYELILSELEILRECSHPNIMYTSELLEDSHDYFVASEILEGGELFDRLIEVKRFSEKDSVHLIRQVLLAINYMHKHKIIHRDLKPENILLESKDLDCLEIKIADFGFSCMFDPEEGL